MLAVRSFAPPFRAVSVVSGESECARAVCGDRCDECADDAENNRQSWFPQWIVYERVEEKQPADERARAGQHNPFQIVSWSP